MGFKALTVNTPVDEEAHILAEDDATLYRAVIGGDCVLPVGSQFPASVTSNNNIRIGDGMLIVGGHVGRIVKYDYEDMAIANGVSGQNRNDLIVARFISGGTAGADDFRLVVVQGTPRAEAEDPKTVQGDLYNGDVQRDYPLWRVRIEGLSIVGVDQLFTVGHVLADKLDKTGDASNVTTKFTQASSRANIASNEKLSVSLGKIMKWFSDIHNALFGNFIKTADGKAVMRSDDEGGEFYLISPEGEKWGIDAYNEYLRIFNYSNASARFGISKTGYVQVKDKLETNNILINGPTETNEVGWVTTLLHAKLPKANVINNLTTTVAGYALDARQGKALNGKITSANTNLTTLLSTRVRSYCNYWGSTLRVPSLDDKIHGIVIISNSGLYLVWLAGEENSRYVNSAKIFDTSGQDTPSFIYDKSKKELFVSMMRTETITYIGI